MAMRRCISAKVLHRDAYIDLPYEAQALYIQLVLATDDDGFVLGVSMIIKQYPHGCEMLNRLLEAGFVLQVDHLYIITHHRVANSLRSDRVKGLDYPEASKKIWYLPNRMYTDYPVENCPTLFDLRNETSEMF